MFSRSFLRLVTVVCVILLLESGIKRPKTTIEKLFSRKNTAVEKMMYTFHWYYTYIVQLRWMGT